MDNKELKEEFYQRSDNGHFRTDEEVADYWIAKMDLQRKELATEIIKHVTDIYIGGLINRESVKKALTDKYLK